MWKVALLVTLICHIEITRAHETFVVTRDLEYVDEHDLGSSINVFDEKAFDIYPMRMIYNNPPKKDVNRDPIPAIFEPDDYFNTKAFRRSRNKIINPFGYVGSRAVDLCESLEQLFQAYFRDIQVEGLPEVWRLLTRKWTRRQIAENFGIEEYYLNRNFSYILVKSSIVQYTARLTSMPRELLLRGKIGEDLDNVDHNSTKSVKAFVKKYGTHYIKSVATGGVLYQVFVFNRTSFKNFPSPIEDPSKTLFPGFQKLTKSQENYLSPQHASYIGKIMTVDGNSTIEAWAERVCKTGEPSFANLFRLHSNLTALAEFQSTFNNEAVVEMSLYPISYYIKNTTHHTLFDQNVNNIFSSVILEGKLAIYKLLGLAVLKIFAPFYANWLAVSQMNSN